MKVTSTGDFLLTQPDSKQVEDPVYDWEETTAPVIHHHFRREVSLDVSDMFSLSDDEYLRKVANLKYGPQKLLQKHNLQDAAMVVLTSIKLSHVLGENIHPRNRYRSLEYTLTLKPWLNAILQSQEDWRQLEVCMVLRRKLRAAIITILAMQRLVDRVQAARKVQALAQCRQHAVLIRKVKKNLSWLGSHAATTKRRRHRN